MWMSKTSIITSTRPQTILTKLRVVLLLFFTCALKLCVKVRQKHLMRICTHGNCLGADIVVVIIKLIFLAYSLIQLHQVCLKSSYKIQLVWFIKS